MKLGDFPRVWLLDTEFRTVPGGRPEPVYLVARECRSGEEHRIWLADHPPDKPPFDQGPDSLSVAYYNSAEWGTYIALGWPLPEYSLDLFAEFRVATNGRDDIDGNSLVDALRYYRESAMDEAHKEAMRQLVLAGRPSWSPENREAIGRYCAEDVAQLGRLFPHLVDERKNLQPALLRAKYMQVMAWAEWYGIPVNGPLWRKLEAHWPVLQDRAVERLNRDIPVYDGRTFRHSLFEQWLTSCGLAGQWPRTATGQLAADDDTMRRQGAKYPVIEPLRQTMQMLGQMKKPGLTVGTDDRNRCLLSPYSTVTGRNAPSTTKYVYGCPGWMRGVVGGEEGTAIAEIDWASQEFGIAAALSGDINMKAAYNSGDCYLAFATLAGAVPAGARKEDYPRERKLFKSTVLGTQYLITAPGLALQLDISLNLAADLLSHHRRVFPDFWRWSNNVCDHAQIYGELTASFGWRMELSTITGLRTLRNFPMQGNASEMLRLACLFGHEAGIRILAPIHDAVLIEAPEKDIDDAVATMRSCMQRASEYVLDGFPLRTDKEVITATRPYPLEGEALKMWQWIEEQAASF